MRRDLPVREATQDEIQTPKAQAYAGVYRAKLAETDLLRRAVWLWTPVKVVPAIPVGKYRQSGSFDICGTEEYCHNVVEILSRYDGFPNLRTAKIDLSVEIHSEVAVTKRISHTFEVDWGKPLRFHGSLTDHWTVGRHFGYTDRAIAAFTTTADSHALEWRKGTLLEKLRDAVSTVWTRLTWDIQPSTNVSVHGQFLAPVVNAKVLILQVDGHPAVKFLITETSLFRCIELNEAMDGSEVWSYCRDRDITEEELVLLSQQFAEIAAGHLTWNNAQHDYSPPVDSCCFVG